MVASMRAYYTSSVIFVPLTPTELRAERAFYNREFQTYIFFQCKSENGIWSFCHQKSTAQIPRTLEFGEFGFVRRGRGFDVKYIKTRRSAISDTEIGCILLKNSKRTIAELVE